MTDRVKGFYASWSEYLDFREIKSKIQEMALEKHGCLTAVVYRDNIKGFIVFEKTNSIIPANVFLEAADNDRLAELVREYSTKYPFVVVALAPVATVPVIR